MRAPNLIIAVGLGWLSPIVLSAESFEAVQKRLDIPSSIAQVADANTSDVPDYILIQDIHSHPEVQAHITALLLHANSRWGMTTTFVEGAYAGQSVKGDASRTSGAEMAAAMAKEGDLKLVGIEDPAVYRDNVEAYQIAMMQQPQVLQEIKTLRMLQRTLDFTSPRISNAQLGRLELLARLKLKPAEHAQYVDERRSHPLSPELARLLEGADLFYRLADRRSEIFIQEALQRESPGPKAIIVGGFHTFEMARELREAGKTYVVLSPHVTQSGYENLYAERMGQTLSALNLR